MGKKVDATIVLDPSLDGFATATEYYLVTAEPTTRADVLTSKICAAFALTGADFTKAAGDVSGRKSTLAAKNIPITTNGTAVGVALCTAGALVAYSPLSASVGFSNGDTAQLSAWKFEVQQPT